MQQTLKAAGLDTRHCFHDLRHTFVTHMAVTGVPMCTLQEWMGHRDIATTQRYADYAPSPHEEEIVAAAFGREARMTGDAPLRLVEGSRGLLAVVGAVRLVVEFLSCSSAGLR